MLINDREYSTVMGSYQERDGMFIELYDGREPNGAPIAECFYSEIDGSISVTRHADPIPDDAIEWLQAEAARRLPPNPPPL